MIRKLLIANRGEIACRIADSAQQLAIATVAIYVDCDRHARHVRRCQQAVALTGEAARGYLDHAQIIRAAHQVGADAIHPGYGFLAENAQFAEACRSAGLNFVGPAPAVIRGMADKRAARAQMRKIGLAVVPGYDGERQDGEYLAKQAARLGYPVLLKAVAGGGGKGMRVVGERAAFAAALATVQRESAALYGDATVILEQYVPVARHIEVQIFGDAYGNVVHLYTRECSLQRRHQKVVEEAPAPRMKAELRQTMCAAAVSCARAMDYVGAGTVEFLLTADGQFYFMEMNTRLQVEHAITEWICGVDLVAWQLQVADGQPLPAAQTEIISTGHAVEARIYAEHPQTFLPTTGRLHALCEPPATPYLRVDSGVQRGESIGTDFDPMLAKVSAWGATRAHALHRLQDGLARYHALGVVNNVTMLRRLVAHARVQNGQYDTEFIAHHAAELGRDETEPRLAVAMACGFWLSEVVSGAGELMAETGIVASDHYSPWQVCDYWQNGVGRAQPFALEYRGQSYRVVATPTIVAANLHIAITGLNQHATTVLDLTVRRDPPPTEHAADRGTVHLTFHFAEKIITAVACQSAPLLFISHANGDHHFKCIAHNDESNPPRAHTHRQSNALTAPMPGVVIAVAVCPGQAVTHGTPLITLEAMKMHHTLTAPTTGPITAIHFAPGDRVTEGDVLLEIG